MNLDTILKAIPSTEPASFGEFCGALGDDAPERGDSKGWARLLGLIKQGEGDGLIEVDRFGGKIGSVMLTESGAARVRSLR